MLIKNAIKKMGLIVKKNAKNGSYLLEVLEVDFILLFLYGDRHLNSPQTVNFVSFIDQIEVKQREWDLRREKMTLMW